MSNNSKRILLSQDFIDPANFVSIRHAEEKRDSIQFIKKIFKVFISKQDVPIVTLTLYLS